MGNGEHEEGEHFDDSTRNGILTTPASAGADGSSPDSLLRETSRLKHVRFIPDPNSVESDLRQDRVKRNILTRFLVVVQYLCLPAKPKKYVDVLLLSSFSLSHSNISTASVFLFFFSAFEPTEEQLLWCEQMVQTALAILSRTNPNGPSYVERIRVGVISLFKHSID